VQGDEDQIRQFVTRWHRASKADDVEMVLSIMTDDVVRGFAPQAPTRSTKKVVGCSTNNGGLPVSA
jgi:ketosteroid isomerase-like protein